MTYRLVYSQRAERDIKKLDAATRERIGRTLLRYEQEPLRHAEKLTDPRLGSYRFRVGEYRIIFDLDRTNIVVLRVGHRREIYKRM